MKEEGHANITFTGSSAGGFVSLKYACIFKQTALILNSQLYPKKHNDFKKLVKTLKDDDDYIVEALDAPSLLRKYGVPKKILLYNNKQDTTQFVNHATPFYTFMSRHGWLSVLEYNIFVRRDFVNKTAHVVTLPEGVTLHGLLQG